jgi:hypothetical protein
LPRACAGPGKCPGFGVPGGRQVKSIENLAASVAMSSSDNSAPDRCDQPSL